MELNEKMLASVTTGFVCQLKAHSIYNPVLEIYCKWEVQRQWSMLAYLVSL